MHWTAADLPDLTGRSAIVTGANSGIGLETALALAAHGASVTLAVRDAARGEAAAARIRAAGGSDVAVGLLDLASLASVAAFAAAWSAEHPRGLDVLVNNAGIMAVPRALSADGFELQFATNYLGHFALTGHLLPALTAQPQARVVNLGSNAHRMVRALSRDDLMGERSYRRWRAYGQSKLAMLLFTSELQRRLALVGSSITSVAAHPGASATDLYRSRRRHTGLLAGLTQQAVGAFGQSAQMGSLPVLFAATAPDLPGGSSVGPDERFGWRGHPCLVDRSAAARDEQQARWLWATSEQLVGFPFPID